MKYEFTFEITKIYVENDKNGRIKWTWSNEFISVFTED